MKFSFFISTRVFTHDLSIYTYDMQHEMVCGAAYLGCLVIEGMDGSGWTLRIGNIEEESQVLGNLEMMLFGWALDEGYGSHTCNRYLLDAIGRHLPFVHQRVDLLRSLETDCGCKQ